VVDHYTAKAWAHVAKVYDAVIDRWAAWRPTSPAAWRCGTTGDPSTARPTSWARSPGWGSPTTRRSLGEPETNGCAERWIRTLKEQYLWAQLHNSVDQFRQPWPASWRLTTPSGCAAGSATAVGCANSDKAYELVVRSVRRGSVAPSLTDSEAQLAVRAARPHVPGVSAPHLSRSCTPWPGERGSARSEPL
jgi:hypothetical protein